MMTCSHANARLLTQACIGVLFGSLLALLLVRLCIPLTSSVQSSEILPWAMANVLDKPREKSFYLCTLVLGYLFASVAIRQYWGLSLSLLMAFLLVAVPSFNLIANMILSGDGSWLFLLINILMMVLAFFVIPKANESFIEEPVTHFQFSWQLFLIPVALITIILVPSSIQAVAAKIGMEMHVASFITGSALYTLGDHLVPGLDYFTQYSLGMGYVFSFFMGKTPEAAIVHYTAFVLIAMWLFYIQITYVLGWLYRSWFYASLTSILSLILLFHTTRHFFDPSSSVLRYPLFGVCAWMISRWITQPRQLNAIILAATLALSLFLNTETGVIMCASFVLAVLLATRKPWTACLPIFLTGAYTLGLFTLLLYVVFGSQVLTLAFVTAFIKPLIIYGRIGFGGWPINWSMSELNWFYNIVAPGIAIATLAMIPFMARQSSIDRSRLAVLAFFTASGLLMMAKFINMSIIAVWQMNALGLLIPLVWWIVWFAKNNRVVYVVVSLSALYIAVCTHDARNEAKYGLQSWVRYPSLVTALFRHPAACSNMSCVENLPAASDVALITARTRPGEPVAIIDLYDWAYLIAAQRPPLAAFLPSIDIFTRDQLQQTQTKLANTAYLFLPKGPDHQPQIDGPLQAILLPTLSTQFVYDGEGERFMAYKRIQAQRTK